MYKMGIEKRIILELMTQRFICRNIKEYLQIEDNCLLITTN